MASAKPGMKIALVGKTGGGKSATANTILARKEFESKASATSITRECRKGKCEVDGRRVTVVDTPGLYDSELSNEETLVEMTKCINLLAPGPHVFLLVMQIGRFTEEEKSAVELIKKAFGEGAEKYIMILFTRGDDLEEEDMAIEDYIKKADRTLKKLIADCGNRFHVFNNRVKNDRTQVKELVEKVDNMVKENGGSYYTNEMLKEAEAAIKEEQEKIMKEKEEQIMRERGEVERRHQQQIEEMKQQGESMKAFVLQLQKEHAKQIDRMMERFNDQSREQVLERANRMLAQTQAARRDSEPCTIL